MPQRTIYYYRVEWGFPEWQGITLGDALARCLAQLPNSGDTRLPFSLGVAEVRHRLAARANVCCSTSLAGYPVSPHRQCPIHTA